MADIFLSYTREDQSIARAIAADLEAEGFSVFYDVRVDVGSSWDKTIERELAGVRAAVVIWSQRSQDSDWVRREAREALARKILCPVLVEACKIPLEFSDVQAADLRGRAAGDRKHIEWRRLCARLAALTGAAPREAPDAPAPRRRNSWEMQLGCFILLGTLVLIASMAIH